MRIAASPVTPLPASGLRMARRALIAAAALLAGACAPPPLPGTTTGAAVAPSRPAADAPARQVDASRPVPVAMLLPLGSARSEDQAIARDMEAAARMAVEDAASLAPIALTVIDSGASGARAAAAAQRAVDGGAAIIIGPTFAEEAQSVAAVARRSGVPILAFSSLAAAGEPPVYVMGFTPEQQVRRILQYAGSQGLRRLALLHPETAYGDVVRAAVAAEAPRFGMSVVDSVSYARNFSAVQAVVGDAAPRLAGSGPDAVLVADSDQALVAVLSFLALADLSPARQQFLGLTEWERGRALRDPALRGGWYPAVDPARQDGFENAFRNRNGRTPHPLAIIAADAVAVVAEMAASARRAGAGQPFTAAAIQSAAGFEGASGRIRFGSDGVGRRDLAVKAVGADGPVLRAPAAPAGS